MDDLDTAIREFTPQQGMWLPLERHFEHAFSSPDPKQYYEDLLLQYFRRHPSLMTRAMLRRILNSGQSHIGRVAISSLIDDDTKA